MSDRTTQICNNAIELAERLETSLAERWARARQTLAYYMPMVSYEVDIFLERLARGLWRMVMIGVILHVAAHFAPELREKMPFVYELFDGGIEAMNFGLRWGIKLLISILQGKLFEVQPQFHEANQELIREFIAWITSI